MHTAMNDALYVLTRVSRQAAQATANTRRMGDNFKRSHAHDLPPIAVKGF